MDTPSLVKCLPDHGAIPNLQGEVRIETVGFAIVSLSTYGGPGTKQNFSPLSVAVEASLECTVALLERGADVHTRDKVGRLTIFHRNVLSEN